MEFKKILQRYGIETNTNNIKPLGNGLINSTWVVDEKTNGNKFVFQRVNENVFKHPEYIAYNIRLINDYFKKQYPEYLFTSPVRSSSGGDIVVGDDGGHYRVFAYVKESVTHNELTKPVQAFEAAKQFGRFSNLLSGIDALLLKTTIPDFHNLTLRFRQFLESVDQAEPLKLEKANEIVHFLSGNRDIVDEYQKVKDSENFKLRVTHHDTKISNVLFDKNDKGLCVIDLDTVMPGYFISDLGDMMRTYLSPVSEEEKDINKIEVRTNFYKAIVQGYLSEMKEELTDQEKGSINYAGKFMIYMQALRFITDYLNNDIYYGAKYDGHNLVRALNQVTLLKRYLEKEQLFSEIISNELEC